MMDAGRAIAMLCAGWLVISFVLALAMMVTCFENRRRKVDDERIRSAANVERDDADDAQRVTGLRRVSERALSRQRPGVVVVITGPDYAEAGRRGLRSDDGVAKLNEAWRRAGDGGGNVGAGDLAGLYRRYAEDNGGCWRDERVSVKKGGE